MAQAQALSVRGPLASRRTGLLLVVVAIVLAGVAFYLSTSYLAAEATKVNAPMRSVYVAARDVPVGTILGPADLATAQIALSDDLAARFIVQSAQTTPPTGIAGVGLAKGRPIMSGDLLPPETAGSVAPLVPLKAMVGTEQREVVGALNVPLGQFAAPPPQVRAHDHVDVWAFTSQKEGSSLQLVLENAEIIAFNGAIDAPAGFVFAVTVEQLDRYLFATGGGSKLAVTVRSSRTQP